jgi:hypothetical protein
VEKAQKSQSDSQPAVPEIDRTREPGSDLEFIDARPEALAQRWVTIAAAAGAANDVANVTMFARMPVWTVPNVAALLAAFKHNPGGRNAGDWVAIAGAAGAANHIANVSAFARMPAWTALDAFNLLANFEANRGSRNAGGWLTIAAAAGASTMSQT